MEELAEASIEDTDGAGLQLDIALRRLEDKCVKSYYRRFNYTRAWASSRKIAYRCSRFRTGCRATMEFTIATMGYSAVRSHTCRAAVPAVGRLQDVTTAMMNRADTLAIEKVALPACLIWEALGDEFYGSGNGNVVRGLSEMQVQRHIYRARHQHFSGHVHGAVEIPPLSLALNEAVSFFQFHYVTINNENLNKPTRLLGWAHPSLINLLRYHGTTLFVDGTFHCVPRGYKQCVIFMVHDRASGIFVPVYYVLSTSRTGDSYWDMMHFVVQGTDQQLEPAEIVCDFETGLLNAVNTQFPNALVIGCLFHLKQALRRAMKRFAIPEEECCIAMISGVLDMLTVAEHSLIERGTKWVKREIRERCSAAGIANSKAKWRGFWDCFRRTWMEKYGVEVWNVAGLDNELIARTNNPLERFNRELNSRFPSPRPSMATFVDVIKTLSSEYVQRLADVPRGRVRRAPRERIQLPVPVEITEDIADDSDEEEGTGFSV
ncbi:hypothetical protein PC119_g18756 [Phytophthora cactorum]|uniref:MULE transposase domain-containing protein n=1 Tax=Phytophthora cactorum TaxID=29920 RepID=A0A8T1C8I9_9STRA|nr:hypothetical protein PC117_g17708 [Phytophthora cactorum]KAG2992067.1 hypothetical protein PC119_g18756 [Phytophthora cactorum]